MSKKIALFDLDSTLADYDLALKMGLRSIASPDEPEITEAIYNNPPAYLTARRHMITSQAGFFANLPPFQLGWDIFNFIKAEHPDFQRVVLTKGPSSKPQAWTEKVQWCDKYLKGDIEGITITHNKGLVYGKILVDDWPEYVLNWLKFRPRGLVIMPAHPHNVGFTHSRVVRYDGTNLGEVAARINSL